MKSGWVYILECSDGSYYVGVTSDIESRLYLHETGQGGAYTAARMPVRLLWTEEFPDMYSAICGEKMIKGWSREKKEALMRGDFESLHLLAQSPEMRERRRGRERLNEKN